MLHSIRATLVLSLGAAAAAAAAGAFGVRQGLARPLVDSASKSCPAGTHVYHLGSHCCLKATDTSGQAIMYNSLSCGSGSQFDYQVCPHGDFDGSCRPANGETAFSQAPAHVNAGASHQAQNSYFLRKMGINPRCILDIGANRGDWTREMRAHYPAAHYLMFEGNAEHLANWADLTSRPNIHPHAGTILADTAKEVVWFKNAEASTGDSMFKETTRYFENTKGRTSQSKTLDQIVATHADVCPVVDYIKVDVQGAELLVLTGGTKALAAARAVQIEFAFFGEYNKGAPKFAEVVVFMDRAGYTPVAILEEHTIGGFVQQIDYLFAKKSFMKYALPV